MVVCSISLLDGTTYEPKDIDKNSTGQAVFDKVTSHLDLVETDYFGLTYRDKAGKKFWIDNTKKIASQVKGGTWVFEFQVKFYAPDPHSLKEDLTRYQLCLQVRVDIFNGRLPCSFVTYALLGSYTVQAELGDYDSVASPGSIEYLKDFDFAPSQQTELLEKIAELHKHHKGQTPEEAESHFLENAKKLAMYGVDLHDVKDVESKPLVLGVCASGILVYKDRLRINRFVWPKILKLSYKRNIFYVQIRPGPHDPHERTVGFKLDNHKLAKRLWKICVEHHAFFRLKDMEGQGQGTLFPRFNTKFRYSGRTQAQAKKAAEASHREEPHIKRTAERRSLKEAKSLDEIGLRKNEPENQGHPDNKDIIDKRKGDPSATMVIGQCADQNNVEGGERLRGPGDKSEDRTDKQHGEVDKKEGMPGYQEGPKGKKEKEDEKKRKKEEERKRKEEEKEREKERKRLEKLEKDKKKTTEDKTDKMKDPNATQTAINGHPDSAELDQQAGFGPGDYGMSAGDDKSIDRKMQFMPIVPPTTETRDRNKSGGSYDSRMPFFEPAGESSTDDSSLGRRGPPPVAKKPKAPGGYDSEEDRLLRRSGEIDANHKFDANYKTERDGVIETRVERKITVTSDENDDTDHDALLRAAIEEVTKMNPDLSVERIECIKQIEGEK